MGFPITTFEERRPFYEDIDQLISPGFLSTTVVINKVRVCIRSPLKADPFLIRNRVRTSVERGSRVVDWKIWTLATCTWMINGYCLLEERNYEVEMYKAYRILPTETLDYLFSKYMGLYNRTFKALRGLEAYTFEELSRRKWSALNNSLPSEERFTGVPGSSRLGLNVVQEIWTALNKYEDSRVDFRRHWYQTRAVMSTHISSKDYKKMASKDDSDDRIRDEDRQRTKDLFYYRCLGSLGWDEDFNAVPTTFSIRPKSVSDLQTEMYNWVSGIKDEHDIIIDKVKQDIRDKKEAEQRQLQEKIESARRKYLSPRGSKPVAYSREQMQEKFLKSQQRTKGVIPDYADDGHEDFVYNKFLKNEPTSANLVPIDGQLLDKREIPELQDKISNRKIIVDDE